MKTEGVRKYHNSNATLLLTPLFICLFISGCATSGGTRGSATQKKAMSQITKGTTTKDEVRSILGKPSGTYKNSDSTEMWTYSSSDFNKKSANRAVVGTAASAAAFIPVVGPAIGLLTFGSMATTAGKVSYEGMTITFDSEGVVSSVSTSSQEFGSN
jgi:outer membrane protein assembly factor BamE (lipoprotein component of BamABCDE complex)